MLARSLASMTLALIAGAGAGWLLRGAFEAPRPHEARRPARTVEPSDAERASAHELSPAPAPADAEAEAERAALEPDGLISRRMLAWAREGIARAWRKQRGDAAPEAQLERGVERFEHDLLALPARIGAELAAEQTAREAAISAGAGFALLFEAALGAEPALEVASDRARMEALLAREVPETVVGALDHLKDLEQAISDGVTLLFPPGVFRVDGRDLHGRGAFPRDVTIAGAGKEATLLLLDDLSMRSKLKSFALRDCTIYVDEGLFDLRNEPATLRLDRVRIVGHDCNHGGCRMLSAPGMLLLATDCDVLGGYGGGGGRLFDDGAFVGRFERCTFADQRIALGDLAPNAAVVFSGCRFVDVLDALESQAAAHPGVKLLGCTVTYAPPDSKAPARDVDDLFPGWKHEIQ